MQEEGKEWRSLACRGELWKQRQVDTPSSSSEVGVIEVGVVGRKEWWEGGSAGGMDGECGSVKPQRVREEGG